MIRNCIIIALIMSFSAAGCRKTESENGQLSKATDETEKMTVAYTFLLDRLHEDNVTSIVSEDDENLRLIQDIVRAKRLKLEVEDYNNIEKGADLCHYSKSTKKLVAIIDVTKRSEEDYYVSYYLGPEGGASKAIIIEKTNGKWAVANDDGMWNVK
jgi:hypothetical protein